MIGIIIGATLFFSPFLLSIAYLIIEFKKIIKKIKKSIDKIKII